MKSLKKGFTLVELMVVIVIIGILAALAIPRFLGATNKTKATEFKPVLKQIFTLEQAYQQESPTGSYGSLNQVGFDAPSGAPYFNYGLGATAVGPAAADQIAAIAAVAPAIAAGGTVANAAPNSRGITIKGTNAAGASVALQNATDKACITDGGELFAPTVVLQSIVGASVTAGNCP
jgi:prepilin-type N-terminal cleavage/methylation domain-containing protein